MVATFATVLMSLGVGISLVIFILMCVCGKAKEVRSLSENHTEDNLNNNDKQEEVELRRRNGGSNLGQEDPERIDSVRPKTLTINRKLPEIPHGAATNSRRNELYATVDEVTHKTAMAASTVDDPSSNHNGTHMTDTNRWSQASKSGPVKAKYEEAHSYAKLRGQTSDDRDTDGETYSNPQIYSRAETSGVRSFDVPLYEPPPPVPDKNYEPGHEQPNQSPNSLSLAASAVSGNSSIADIPFMTSPVPPVTTYADDSDSYSNTLTEIRYTSISVREPLANIRAQMVRQEASSSLSYPESHYSVVPEDADQMYAEIESAQNSTSSVTYNIVGPLDVQQPSTSAHYPPAPPTVESLRTVAQAHSRHASSSSCISDCSYPNSPATERSFVINGSVSPDFSGMYSIVDKTKKSRSTVHVMEKETGQHSVEDMYAKVKKNRPQTMKITSTFGDNPKPVPQHSSSVVIADEPIGNLTANILRRQSSGKDDPGYEKIRERKIETENEGSIVQLPNISDFNLVEIRRKTITSKREDGGDTDSDPGYEVVKSEKTFPGYETIKEKYTFNDEVSEHSYEKVNKITDDEDRVTDPGYERVGDSAFSRSDPNYESVHYSNVKHEDSETTAASIPQYWQIRGREEAMDPLYERINSQEEDQTEPNYEKVKTVSELSYDASDPGYERVGQRTPLEEDGYEKIHDRLCDQVDPGYELITEKRECKVADCAAVDESDSDSGPDNLYSVPMRPFHKLDSDESQDTIIKNAVDVTAIPINNSPTIAGCSKDSINQIPANNDQNELYDCNEFYRVESLDI